MGRIEGREGVGELKYKHIPFPQEVILTTRYKFSILLHVAQLLDSVKYVDFSPWSWPHNIKQEAITNCY